MPAPGSAPGSGFLKTIPLDCVDDEPDSGTHGHVFGVVRSVSVVFSVPRAGQKSNADGGDNSVGFIAEMMCCACRQCRVLPPEPDRDHKFELEKFVYFVDSASRWRPVLARMVGRPVSVSGLKKRLVSVGKKGSYTMLVSTRKTMLRWCPSYPAVLKLDESVHTNMSCGGVYTGVVTGIYMQLMLVELDEIIWLLIDDQHLVPSHSLRVGAVISVKNGRSICLKLAWTRILLLGTCIKTNITINSFSLVDSKSYIKAENKGLLGKFVDSFELPARFCMLILIPCFKQKFTKLFSEKEILGSKYTHGLVHTYASKVLSSMGSKPQHDFFMKFSNHNCGSPHAELNLETFKLVIPFANFICKCESFWMLTMLKIWNGTEEMDKNQGGHQFLCDGISYPGTAKKLISSIDLGSVLVGRIKRSSLPGTLQLVDATGCIDVIIPDLPSNVCMDSIYEINDYKVVLEGPMAYLDPYDVTDPLSCKAVCEHLSFRKRLNHLKVFVIINWSELNRIGPSSIPLQINTCAKMFHLLKLTHIFPANKTFQHQNLPGPSLYAEAVILPYDLKFTERDECSEHAESFRISCIPSLGNSRVYTAKPCNILCTLSFGTTNLCGSLVSICSCGSVSTIVNDTVCGERDHTSRILLEFKDGRFKYQSPRIGGYYLLECPTESLNYSMKGCGCLQVSKVSLGSQSGFWGLAITFNGNINIKQALGDQSIGVSSVKMDEPFSRKAVYNEIKLVHTWNDFHQYCDFHLKFYCEEQMDEYNYICHVFNELHSYSNEVLSVSSFVKTRVPKMPSGSSNLQRDKLFQGDLISLQGKVENIHPYGRKKEKIMVGNEKSSICIHVTDDNHRVRLFGYLSKHGYPVGLGPGASATFHRVLLTHKHELFFTPLTYIEVSSISLAGLNEECVVTPPISDCFKDGSLGRVSSCLLFLSQKHLAENRAIQFQCRVVAIHVLVLDNILNDLQPSESRCETINVKVRLAGFIVDDGSSLCCCWADDARAKLLLGLQDIAVLDASVTSRCSKNGVMQQTVGSFLESLLKKHKRIIARNCGIPPNISCRDLELSSVLNKVLSCLEEKLLKSIILNACWKGTLNVVASALNANMLNGFNLELPDLHPVWNMPNFWVNQAFHIDPLEEARRMFDKLENS